MRLGRAGGRWAFRIRRAALGVLFVSAAPLAASATAPADSLIGRTATCVDFRSGETFTIGAQHLLGDGTLAPQWSPDGTRLCLGSAQEIASVTVPDGSGGAMVVWVDTRSGDADIYAQHLTSAGAVASGWPADGIAVCVARDDQYQVAAVSDGAGGAIAVWQDYRAGSISGIYAQRILAGGGLAWPVEGVPVSADSTSQSTPSLVPDQAGGALVVWQEARASDADVRWARIGPDGAVVPALGGAVLVSGPGDQRSPLVVPSRAGHAVAVWQEAGGGATKLRCTSLDLGAPTGLANGASGTLLVSNLGTDPVPAICGDDSGGVYVAWCARHGGWGDIRLQHLSRDGTPVYADTGLVVCDEPHEQYGPSMCRDGTGGCLVAWEDFRSGGGDLYAQRLSGTGALTWAQGGNALCVAQGLQYAVVLREDGSGGALATWSDQSVSQRAAFAAARPSVSGELPQLLALEKGPGRVHLTWRGSEGDVASYLVERRTDAEDWSILIRSRLGPGGRLEYEDRSVLPGAHATYRLVVESRGGLVGLQEIPVEIPLPMPLTLRWARVDADGRMVHISYVLETNEPASLELLDVAGRRVMTRALGSPGAGEHDERFTSRALPAGVYFVRLTQNRQTRTARLMLIR